MAAGERGKAIEELVAGITRGQEELRGATDISRGILGTQRGQIRTDIGRQRELTEGGFGRFIEAGIPALQDVQRGATVGGLDERITEILGTGAFQGLREERFGDINRQLASAGLSRSGLGLEEIANISPDLAFQIENQLFGRSRDLSNVGFQGVERRGAQGAQLALGQAGFETGLSQFEAQIANQLGVRLAGGEVGIGEAQSVGRLEALKAGEAKTAARNKFIGDIAGTAASFFPATAAFAPLIKSGVTGGLEAF